MITNTTLASQDSVTTLARPENLSAICECPLFLLEAGPFGFSEASTVPDKKGYDPVYYV